MAARTVSSKSGPSPGRAAKRLVACAAFGASLLALAGAAASCSLGNVAHDACETNVQCEGAFGLGSACQDGFCTKPSPCETSNDCAAMFAGGACVNGVCSASCDGTRADGIPCVSCPPSDPADMLNTCTDAACVRFDNTRVKKLGADGSLPPLPGGMP